MDNYISNLVWVYGSAAILATIFLILKQPVIVGYIFAGILIGEPLLNLVNNDSVIEQSANLGIVLLLFINGVSLRLIELKKLTFKFLSTVLLSSLVLWTVLFLLFKSFSFTNVESAISAITLIFSSTILGLKLMPTSDLHQKRIGEIMITFLLIQDVIAILFLIAIMGSSSTKPMITILPIILLKAILFFIALYVIVNKIIMKLAMKFDTIQDYLLLLSLGWCFISAEIGEMIGLSYIIGALLGGITLSSLPFSQIMGEALKPIREFFLIIFLFAIGAKFKVNEISSTIFISMVISLVIVSLKQVVYSKLFNTAGESKESSEELGTRLSQGSEFAFVIASIAVTKNIISSEVSTMIQVTTILSFMISTYVVVGKYATPISTNSSTRRD